MKPLRFKPLLKQTLWGGNKIIPFKHLHDNLENVGESWEISGVPGNETIVSEGEYAGQPLSAVVADHRCRSATVHPGASDRRDCA